MAALGSQTIAASYEQLLHVDTDGGGDTTTLVPVKDGDNGTTFCLQLATTKAMIEGNGSTLYFFDEGGESISADNAGNLTLAAGVDLNLTATTDINIPASVGLTFGHASNQKIEGDGTDLSIDATGNINVTSTVDEAASIYLHANAGTSETVKVHADQGTGAASLNLLSDAGGITLSAGNTSHGVIVGDVSGAPVKIGHTTSETTVNDNLTVTGDLTMTAGNLVIATADKGISFTGGTDPDTVGTATANILDDYEEGTWSPTLISSGASITMDGITGGKYVKVGALVTISGGVATDSVSGGSASNGVSLSGLPFTSATDTGSTEDSRGAIILSGAGNPYAFAGDVPRTAFILETATTATLRYRAASNGMDDALRYDDLNTGGNSNIFYFRGTYHV